MSNTGSLATQICESLRRSTQALYGADLGGLTKDERESIAVTNYANCREQGFHVRVQGIRDDDSFACSFSEERGSDLLVLYTGRPSDFDIRSGLPNTHANVHAERFRTEKQLARRLQKLIVSAAREAAKSFRKAA
jgi:hypothetical protein